MVNGTFAHTPNCPALVLEQLEKRGINPAPRLVAVELDTAELVVAEGQRCLAKIDGQYTLGCLVGERDQLSLEADDGAQRPLTGPGKNGSSWEGLWAIYDVSD